MEIRGLKNEGENNCYLNVIVQTFWNLAKLKSSLISVIHTHEETNCVTCELSVFATQNLFINMKYSGLQNFSIKSLKKCLFFKSNKILTNDYGCAAESFEEMLNFMHLETFENNSSIITQSFSIRLQEKK